MRTVVTGGGAAGFFLAVNLKEMLPGMDVTIVERSSRVLSKVALSGGGRCNCTNTFEGVKDLQSVYPRGHRLMKRLFSTFGPREACEWFEAHGVALTVEDGGRIFPVSQDAQTVVLCLHDTARRLGVTIVTDAEVKDLDELADYDFKCVTTGGQPRREGLQWLERAGHAIEEPVPSLFTLSVPDEALHALMGTAVSNAVVQLPGTRLRAGGDLLVTHWGLSGPAVLRLSSYAARHLAECGYHTPLAVNWTGRNDAEALAALLDLARQHQQKRLASLSPLSLPQRLWTCLLQRAGADTEQRWADVGKKQMNRLVNTLCNDTYTVSGRAPFKDEFVTCGGVSLTSVNPNTLESRVVPSLYFAGEVLDVDGVTGGFNFQAAWTTAYTVAAAINAKTKET